MRGTNLELLPVLQSTLLLTSRNLVVLPVFEYSQMFLDQVRIPRRRQGTGQYNRDNWIDTCIVGHSDIRSLIFCIWWAAPDGNDL